MDDRAKFLLEAVKDNQLTVRAIDIKVAALLVALLAPLSGTSRIFAHLEHVYKLMPHWYVFAGLVIFLLAWLCALISLIGAIGGIDNPAAHIPNAKLYKGVFYGGGHYKFRWVDAFISRAEVCADSDPAAYLDEIPDGAGITKELAFEQLKVAYIRDTKLARLRYGLNFAATWLFLGICIYLASRYLPG